MKIGLDIMGGDYAPRKTVHGAILALDELPKNIRIVLFGNENEILFELKKHNISAEKFEIINCSEVISMEEHATKAFRSKPNSSIAKGFEYLTKGEIDGFASAGNTGAMFVGGFYAVKVIPGILRPPLAALMPREDGGVKVLLDVGANADCKPDVLYQFGVLGSLFSKYVCNIKKPKVSLLNLGEEKNKRKFTYSSDLYTDGRKS
jgi:glycerol-3-phosphate acyltransferase PlsX